LEHIFIDHAQEQMKERGISEEEAIKTINNPDDFFIQLDTRHVAIKTIKKRKITVIYLDDKENGIKTVITAKFKWVK